MTGNPKASGRRRTTALLGLFAAILVVSIIAYPDQAFSASLQGLTVWWKYVFPALLPFLILSELLLGYGVVHALGTLLDPLMRNLLRIPGSGGWALALGATIGHPAGARAAAALRKQGLLTRTEAERLLAVSHLSSPVFIVTIVGVGFLHSARLGALLAAVHTVAALAVGLTIRLLSVRSQERETYVPGHPGQPPSGTLPAEPLTKRIITAMQDAHTKDGRAFGKLLGDAVSSSVQTLMMVGGYMIIFSVLVQIIEISRLTSIIQHAALLVTGSTSYGEAVRSAVTGLLEIHLGTYAFGAKSGLSGAFAAAAVAAVLGWGGISSHLQVRSITNDTDLGYMPFVAARLLHAAYSFVLTLAVWEPVSGWLGSAPSFAAGQPPSGTAAAYPQPVIALALLTAVILLMLLLSLGFHRNGAHRSRVKS
ncbi:nucleoside recognition domain-containing protein [Paenibacillus chartarius]|uniref:Nucleoside recognition domain-containing protein n=1 Tax=Paenibacillus chartarius TaxID=747481 RepID=A0ABV6DNR7_9BACL